jgi:hypothetical protein
MAHQFLISKAQLRGKQDIVVQEATTLAAAEQKNK